MEKDSSERQLSTNYEVSRITVRKTLELMEKENLIVQTKWEMEHG